MTSATDRNIAGDPDISFLKNRKLQLLSVVNDHCEKLRRGSERFLKSDRERVTGFADNAARKVEMLADNPNFKANPDLFIKKFDEDFVKVVESVQKSASHKVNIRNHVKNSIDSATGVERPYYENDILGGKTGRTKLTKPDVDRVHFGDLSSHKYPVNQGFVQSIKESSDQLSHKGESLSYKDGIKIAQAQSHQEFNRDMDRLDNLVTQGRDVNSNELQARTPVVEKEFKRGGIGDAIHKVVSKKLRNLSNSSEFEDSKSYQKYLKKRDVVVAALRSEMSSSGVASHIMDYIEGLLSKSDAVSENGMIDQLTFQRILEMLNDQRKKDGEGISDRIMDELNKVNKRAVKHAKEEVENEDSVSTMRLLQIALILAPILGVAFLGPIFSGVGGAIAAGGVSGGASSIATAGFLGPIGDVAGFLGIDQAIGWLLTDLPILGDFVGVFDTILLSEPGQIIAQSLNLGLFTQPLIPIVGAIGFSMYMGGNEKYNAKKDRVSHGFKSISKQLEDIEFEERGNFDASKAGGDLKDSGKRRKFVTEKYDLFKNSSHFESIADFIDAIMQSSTDESFPDIDAIFSKPLQEFFAERGLFKPESVTDKQQALNVIAKIMYADDDNHRMLQVFKGELSEKFGVFFKEYKSNSHDLKETVESMVEIFADNGRTKVASEEGNRIYNSLYHLSIAKERGISDFDDNLLSMGSYSDNDIARLEAASKKVKDSIIEQESRYIEDVILQHKGERGSYGEEGVRGDTAMEDLAGFNRPKSLIHHPGGDPLAIAGRNNLIEA